MPNTRNAAVRGAPCNDVALTATPMMSRGIKAVPGAYEDFRLDTGLLLEPHGGGRFHETIPTHSTDTSAGTVGAATCQRTSKRQPAADCAR